MTASPLLRGVRDAVVALGWAAVDRHESGTGDVPAAIGALANALDRAEADPAGAQLARLGALTDSAEEQILLALMAGPALDASLAEAHVRVADALAGGDRHALGVLLALASPRPEDHDRLRATLGDDRALVRRYLVACSPGPRTDASRVLIADTVAATYGGAAVHAPTAAQLRPTLEHAMAAPVCTALGLWPLRPMLNVLAGPNLAGQAAAARLLTAWRNAAAWSVTDRDLDWGPLVRDAALANAVVTVDLDGADMRALDAIQQAAVRLAHPVIGTRGPARGTAEAKGLPRLDLPGSLDRRQIDATLETLTAIAGAVATLADA